MATKAAKQQTSKAKKREATAPAVVRNGTLTLRNKSIELIGIRDGKYPVAVEFVDGRAERMVIDFTGVEPMNPVESFGSYMTRFVHGSD